MLVSDARGAARGWVREHAAREPGFRGAFFSGSVAAGPAVIGRPACGGR